MSEISASLLPINPLSLFTEGFELSNQDFIPSKITNSIFTPERDKVEFFIYDLNQNILSENYDFNDWYITSNSNPDEPTLIDEINLQPIEDALNLGFNTGEIFAVYNFIRQELNSDINSPYFLSEISSDRTEIRIKSNNLTNEQITNSYNELKNKLQSSDYFDEFYISFGDNQYIICVNVLLDSSEGEPSILIKLYNPLPLQYQLRDTLYVISKVAETQAFKITFPSVLNIPVDVTYLRGPNKNLNINDFVNNSTEFKSKSDILNTPSTSSKYNVSNILNKKGITITPNYSYDTFDEFVHFSSAKKRIENFIYKVSKIQSYENEINILNNITGSTSQSLQVSSSFISLNSNIENIIKNFDGYEYYLYYNSSSFSYPKSNQTFPYTLYDVDSTESLQWVGSDIENSQYYGGIILSASLFDNNNQNWLYYTIPEFIRSNQDNDNYLDFVNMVGQHFDELWLYTKEITQKLNSTSQLDEGAPLDLVNEIIESLGYKGYGNNFSNQDIYLGLSGENDVNYTPPTGSELITNYIAVNNGEVINFWGDLDETLPSFPYSIDKVSKEIFKRLYHNMVYLAKKKGTISGLRQLLNIWGIPDTILRISEFGGKNKDNINDYDLWYDRYSYAFTATANQAFPSASILIPWEPLQRNLIADGQNIVPDCIQFRFKTTGYPSSSEAGTFFTQSLLVKKTNGDETDTQMDFGISLFYTGSLSGSYSGSSSNEYQDWGIVRFYLSGSSEEGGVAVSDDIYLPFFNQGWWSVMLQRDQHSLDSINTDNTTYTLYVKNKIYNGWDGNQIGFEASSSIYVDGSTSSSLNNSWNKSSDTSFKDGIHLGGYISGSQIGDSENPIILGEPGKMFSGSFQEFRYYSYALPEEVFNDFVMNPESIEGINITGSLSSFDILNFRAPLGNELETKFTTTQSSSYDETLYSSHPAVTGSLPTQSFAVYNTNEYYISYYETDDIKSFSKPNVETYFLDQPAVGIRNRISNKIQIQDNSVYGNVLSNQTRIQQNYQINESYTENINSLEVSFSPQDEINDDIIQTFGFGVISDVLGDPRAISSNEDFYPQLRKIAEEYFLKYTKGNIYDYLRLIKYFDNSIFKAIKNYVPARTSVSTGVVIKQHLLERNRIKPVQLTEVTQIATTPSGGLNTPINVENLEITSSIDIGNFEGGTGGVLEQFNYLNTPSFTQTPITQSWINTFDSIVGLQTITQSSQDEFYNGEFSGSNFIVTTQSLFNNPFTTPSSVETIYQTDINELPTLKSYSDSPTNMFLITGSIDAFPNIGSFLSMNPPSNFINAGTGSIVWISPTTNPRQWSVTGIVVFEAENVFGGKFDNLFSNNIGNNFTYPDSSFYNNWWSGPDSWKQIPFFQFSLPQPLTGSYESNGDEGSPISSSNLPWNVVTSFGLRIAASTQGSGYRGWTFQPSTLFDGGVDIDQSRPILFFDDKVSIPTFPSDFNFTSSFIYNDVISSLTNLPTTCSISQSILNTIPSPAYLDPADTGSSSNFNNNINYWTPSTFLINNIDINGNNNFATLNANPTFNVAYPQELTPWSSNSNIFKKLNFTSYPFQTKTYNAPSGTHRWLFQPDDITNENLLMSKVTSSVSNLIDFDPYIDPSVIFFENSDFFPIQNNFNENRANSYIMDVEYTDGISIPSNLSLILNRTAQKTQTPDSNYTSNRNTIMKYVGSKTTSATYNKHTAGDISYGNTAAIDKYPIYIARVSNKKDNFEYWDTNTFTITDLIRIPFNDILNQEVSSPEIIQIEGTNDRLFDIISTFEIGRQVTPVFTRNLSPTEAEVSSLNQSNIIEDPSEKKTIYQAGLKYDLILGTQKNIISTRFTCSFDLPTWLTGSNQVPFNSSTFFLQTGSGFFKLTGAPITVSGSYLGGSPTETGGFSLTGPGLGLIHSLNILASSSTTFNTSSFSPIQPGIPVNLIKYDIANKSNYYKLNISSSGLSTDKTSSQGIESWYEDANQPFIIKPGDEIRVTLGSSFTGISSQDFTVLSVESSGSSGSSNEYTGTISGSLGVGTGNIAFSSIFNIIKVYPDPSTFFIQNGRVLAFTIRRRINADNKVIIFSQFDSTKSPGFVAESTEGFLIPDDLTDIQKRNVKGIINKLTGLNAF